MPHLLRRGLYEALISERLNRELASNTKLTAAEVGLRSAEAADRIALHLGGVIEKAIASIGEERRAADGVALSRKLVEMLTSELTLPELLDERPAEPGRVLQAILAQLPDGNPETIAQPLIPLLDTTLLTNAPGEPRVGSQILAEVYSADRIDVLMAFIRRSGITPLLEALRLHCAAGRTLRVLTTTYTNSTEARALDELRSIGAEVRISYDESTTRLHAKAWLFHRASGFSTAYIGSSNLTHSAQVTGLEWNVRVSGARNPAVIDKVGAVFESYWNAPDFAEYEAERFIEHFKAAKDLAAGRIRSFDIRLEPFQDRLVEQVALARQQGHHRNLLVSATGTGKTVMAAVDYVRLRETLPRAKLLFVAHREELLTQAIDTFRHAMRDHAFGEKWVGGERPLVFENVFASIQSLTAAGLAHIAPDFFDVVIIDEFHHAAANSYRALLEHLKPIELLGLTATPERTDGLSVLDWFDGRIAAELRLWDAIDQHRLVPFAYYGVHDGIDLRDVPWRRGTGYDVEQLTNRLTANDIWAKFVIHQVGLRVSNVNDMRALGFCVSVDHARFMARVFNDHGIASVAISADTAERERQQALRDLRDRKVKVVFSVDLFNEGVDVPAVDTLLMLRPTESATLFLQQLGRGLRKSTLKSICTVLDFVGHHRSEFRFDAKLRALLGGTRHDLEQQVEQGFPFLPAGCHMELDRVAADIVLRSIRAAVPAQWQAKVAELRALNSRGGSCSLSSYLAATGLDIDDIYAGGRSWSELMSEAGLSAEPSGPHEDELRRACGRILHVDDDLRISTWRRFLTSKADPKKLSERDRRLLRMLVATIAGQVLDKRASLDEAYDLLWRHAQVRRELVDVFEVLSMSVKHLPVTLTQQADVPLLIHARYSRIEILAAWGVDSESAKVAPWQTGVRYIGDAKTDLLVFTLDKTSGQFSPTTRYNDYAISRDLVHWQSQSATRADSKTGLRYQHHLSQGSSIMLFARQRADDRAFYFLGPATYVSHESEMPMSIRWRLALSLPGDLFASFAAAVA